MRGRKRMRGRSVVHSDRAYTGAYVCVRACVRACNTSRLNETDGRHERAIICRKSERVASGKKRAKENERARESRGKGGDLRFTGRVCVF